MAEYVLDVAKWRCGGYGKYQHPNLLGEGDVQMLNEQGYMCCLGQFASGEVEKKHLLGKENPVRVADSIGEIYDYAFVQSAYGEYDFTSLAFELIDINDTAHTTPVYKIQKIREALEANGHTLKVIDETGILKNFVDTEEESQ